MRVLCLITMALLSTVALNQVSAAPQFFNRAGNFFRGVRDFPRDFSNGVREMTRAYDDMRDRNVIGSDQYYHARGNRDAAAHGLGGRVAASIISNGREVVNLGEAIVGRKSDSNSGGGNDGYVHDRFSDAIADSAKDQKANLVGRNGGNIDVYRVNGMEGHE